MAGGPSKDAKALAARVNALDGFRAVVDSSGSHGGLSYTVQREVEGGKWKFVSHIPGHASYESLALVRAETALRSKGVPLPRLDKTQPKEKKTVATTVDVQGELRTKLRQLLTTRYGGDSELLARDFAAVVADSDLEQFGGPNAKSKPRDVALQAIHSALSVGRDLGDKNVERFTLCIARLENGGPPAERHEVPDAPALRAQVKGAIRELASGMGHYADAEGAAQAHFSRRASVRVEGAGEREGALALYRFLTLKRDPDPRWAAAFAAEANLAQVTPSDDPANRMIAARGRKYVDEELTLREPSEALRERLSQVLKDRNAYGFSRDTKRAVIAARSKWAEEVAPLLPESPRHGPATRERVMSWVGRFVQDGEMIVADLATITAWNAALDKIAAGSEAEPAALRTVAADDDDGGSGLYDDQGVDLAQPPRTVERESEPTSTILERLGRALSGDEASVFADMQEELEMYRELEKELRQEIADISAERNALVDEVAAAEAAATAAREEVAAAEREVAEARVSVAEAQRLVETRPEPVADLRSDYAALLLRLAEAPEPMPEGREKVLERLDRLVGGDAG